MSAHTLILGDGVSGESPILHLILISSSCAVIYAEAHERECGGWLWAETMDFNSLPDRIYMCFKLPFRVLAKMEF